MTDTPETKAQAIIADYTPQKKHLLSLYRRNTVYKIVQEAYPNDESEWTSITNTLWDLLHP